MGSQPKAPPPPDYAKANREGILTDLETLPSRRAVEAAASLGQKVTIDTGKYEDVYEEKQIQVGTRPQRDPQTGKLVEVPVYQTQRFKTGRRPITKSYDFTGLGDDARLQQQLDFIQRSAPGVAQSQYELQKQYDPLFIDLATEGLRRSDPYGFSLDEELKRQALDDLRLGDSLSPEQLRLAQQRTRQAQEARGNILGPAPSFQEAFDIFDAGTNLKLQRQNTANSILGRGPTSGQFATLTGAQNGATPFRPFSPQPLTNVNPNAGAQGTQFALQRYGTQAQIYQTQSAQSNPWMQGLGLVLGAGTGLGAAALYRR